MSLGSNPAGLCSSSADGPSLSIGVNTAAHPPRGSTAKAGSLTALSLPLFLFGK